LTRDVKESGSLQREIVGMIQLADRLGPARAAELVFLSEPAEPVSAEQLCAWNDVNPVVDDAAREQAGLYRPPETWARRAYRNLIYFHEVDRGGHFAVWDQPELFSAELRAAFRSLREANWSPHLHHYAMDPPKHV
jgi:hypothetical protein